MCLWAEAGDVPLSACFCLQNRCSFFLFRLRVGKCEAKEGGGWLSNSWFLWRRRPHHLITSSGTASSSADALGLWDHEGNKSQRMELTLFCWCSSYLWISQLCWNPCLRSNDLISEIPSDPSQILPLGAHINRVSEVWLLPWEMQDAHFSKCWGTSTSQWWSLPPPSSSLHWALPCTRFGESTWPGWDRVCL